MTTEGKSGDSPIPATRQLPARYRFALSPAAVRSHAEFFEKFVMPLMKSRPIIRKDGKIRAITSRS